MGAGSSSPSTELANSLLTKLFTQTDMLAYLTMTDPKACVKFDFSSVNPSAKKDISAGVRIQGQNSDAICFEQAKGYSKCFELYAALYPILADTSVKRSGLLKGGRRTRRQRGGGDLVSTGKEVAKISTTPLMALFLIKDTFYVTHNDTSNQYDISLYLSEKTNTINFSIKDNDIGSDSIRTTGKANRGIGSTSERVDCEIELKKTDQTSSGGMYEFSINSIKFLVLNYDNGIWYYSEVNEGVTGEPNPLSARKRANLSPQLIKKIKESVGFTGQASSSSSSGASTSTSVTGAFFPPTVGEVKKNLANYKDAKKNKPVALAVARALILLRPLDAANSTGRPPTTQICAKTFTFEGKDSHVPRKGVALEKTYYFKSWMNLYTDTGEFRAGKYEWIKGAEGMKELNQAAEDLAILYSQQPDPKFLSKPLPEFITLCSKYDGEYYIDPKVMPDIQKVVNQLLNVQKTYVGKANSLLAEVFDFKADGSVAFRKDILGREGYAKLSELCKRTRHTLFEYYMMVESLFIKGIMIYETALANKLLKPV